MPTKYNYDRYSMSEYDLGSFPGPRAGEEAWDFTLTTLDGREVSLSDYRGKWVVIETGSITCSMYVKNIGGVRRLENKFPDVEFLLVYVREAHPGSRLRPPQDQAEKLVLGGRLKEIYGDPRDILVDTLDGDMHRRYGALPNMVYIIDPDGRIAYRCDWAFPANIKRVLDNRPNIDTQEHVQIITAAPWIMVPVVLRGGWDALWDLLVALPKLVWAHLVAAWQNLKKKPAG
jgi:hypothetical protein